MVIVTFEIIIFSIIFKIIFSLNKVKKVLPAARVTFFFFAMRVIENEQFFNVGLTGVDISHYSRSDLKPVAFLVCIFIS